MTVHFFHNFLIGLDYSVQNNCSDLTISTNTIVNKCTNPNSAIPDETLLTLN